MNDGSFANRFEHPNLITEGMENFAMLADKNGEMHKHFEVYDKDGKKREIKMTLISLKNESLNIKYFLLIDILK